MCYDALTQNTLRKHLGLAMTLDDIINKSCVIGLSYFDGDDQLLKQSMLAGNVTATDEENGITITLIGTDLPDNASVFILPSSLAPWFNAPKGTYKDENSNVLIEHPDYLVTWDIHRTQEDKEEGDHEWWNWVARTTPPSVG
ncbi:hypothetical protein A9Q81_10900 [Gammaproteobacteria bacterium 42_54_T18]|nr:hypothetical protein A9Q81_10900 [Gammaproteobacteria bacterium 42_54_T18]